MPQGSKTEKVPTGQSHTFRVRLRFTPKWSRDWVIPSNVLRPGATRVVLKVDSNIPTNRPAAHIEYLHVLQDSKETVFSEDELQLRGSKVVTANGKRPTHSFELDDDIWMPFDKLLYHFECRIDQTAEQTTKPLKVKRWHVQAVDSSDNNGTPGNIYLSFRTTEKANFLAAFSGSPDDLAKAWEFNATSTSIAKFGKRMKNTYTFVYTGHGAVMCRLCLQMFDSSNGTSDADFGRWTTCKTAGCKGSARSTHGIGGWQLAPTPSFMDGGHVSRRRICPTTPKYLMFSVCCGGAFERSLYRAYIRRGTQHCVGFKKSTRCDWARDYAKSFFDTWVKVHKCDPAKISKVFNGLKATWNTKLQQCSLEQPLQPRAQIKKQVIRPPRCDRVL